MEFKVQRNDITNMDVDAIVLPANTRLAEGSGSSTIIFGKAGRTSLKKELSHYGRVEVGKAVITNGYNLPANYIIHAVVPKWHGGRRHEYELLSKAYLSTLCLADQQKCKSLAIPLLSSGRNGFDLDTAIEVAIFSIWSFEPTYDLTEVTLVVFDSRATFRMASLDFEIEEVVDQAYVNAQRDFKKPLIARKVQSGLQIAGGGAQVAGQVAYEGLVAASNFVNNNPTLQQTIAVTAVQVVALALNGGKPDKKTVIALLSKTAVKLLGF